MKRRILAFDVQDGTIGGLLKGFLAQLERALPNPHRAPVMATGISFTREKGRVTQVVAKEADGYLGNGASTDSLCAIDPQIDGAHWFGPRFFGVTPIKSKRIKSRTKILSRPQQPRSGPPADSSAIRCAIYAGYPS